MKKVTNQHGDLLFYEVNEIPKDAKKVDAKNGYVIERGEGVHTHVFTDVSGIEIYEKDGETYVRVKADPKIDHEEHGHQLLEPGIKKKGIEREWDYETEEARKVID